MYIYCCPRRVSFSCWSKHLTVKDPTDTLTDVSPLCVYFIIWTDKSKLCSLIGLSSTLLHCLLSLILEKKKKHKVTSLFKYRYIKGLYFNVICSPILPYKICIYLPTLLSLRSLVRWWHTFPVAALSNSGINS